MFHLPIKAVSMYWRRKPVGGEPNTPPRNFDCVRSKLVIMLYQARKPTTGRPRYKRRGEVDLVKPLNAVIIDSCRMTREIGCEISSNTLILEAFGEDNRNKHWSAKY